MSTLLRRIPRLETPEKLSPFDGESSKVLAARALQSILRGLLVAGALYLGLVIPLFVARKAAASAMWAALLVITLACTFLLRQGYVRLSGWIFVSAVWLFLSVFVVFSGGIRSPALLSHIAVIVVSAWLLDRSAAICIAVLSLSMDLVMAIMESTGAHLPRYFPAPPIVAWLIASVLISLAILPLASVSQALADLATQARRELEARRLEERVRAESDERFRATFFQAAVGIAHVGLEGDWLLMNDRFCQMLGYTHSELREKALADITHPDDLEAVLTGRRQLLAGEIPFHTMEKRYIRKDQSIFWGSLYRSLVRDEENRPKYFIAVIEDINDRKQADAALRESEERFRNMADSAPVMIWVSGLDKVCTFFNKPWLDFTGRTMEQELGNGWAEGVHQEDLDRCLATYNSSFDARRPFQMEYRLRRADGEYRWILDNGTPLNRGGEFIGFIGSSIDISDQKLMAEELRAQSAQLIDAQRLANVGSWERYLNDDQIQRSEQMLRILGLSSDAPATFQAFIDGVHPRDRGKVLEASRKVRVSIAPIVVEYRIVRPDGEVRFVRSIVEAIRNDGGEPTRIAGATQDVTEQVKARELLRESEERLRKAERLAHVGHWHWDPKSDQLSWSEGMFHIFGQTRDCTPSYEALLGAVVTQDRERLRREIRDALADHSGFSSEVQITRSNGDLHTITFVGEALQNEDGFLLGMFGAAQDITDLRRAQRVDFARQKLESIGTLASGIAHDFNNLLGSVLVQAEVALRGLAVGSKPEEELKTIRDVALRGSEIVRELMIYAGKDSAVVELVNVSKIVKEMLELLNVSLSKHAVLEVNLGQNLPSVRANAAQLRQIVMNLVTNASDALGDHDGVIRLTTRCVKVDPDSQAISEDVAEHDYVQLEVSDTGCGIPPEMQAKVFDPFFTTKSAGHGLGLAMVDGIVRALGGTIRLTSEPGHGTTFQILLPCETGAAGQSDAISGTEDLGPVQRANILIVEDEDPLRQAVTKMLRQTGFAVFEVADGFSAIDLLRVNGGKIDLILLDMTIPGASSAEVIAEAAKVRPDIRVVLTSAYSQEMIARAMKDPQIRGFIRKPFQLGNLERTLRNTLSMS
jgi:PAS domain S-box-containing protein